jgi:hypothetical protein
MLLHARWALAVAVGSTACLMPTPQGATSCTTDDDCEAGAVCVADICVTSESCSLAAPDGVCPLHSVCHDGACMPFLCSPAHLDGVCGDPGEFCSALAECIPMGACRVEADCQAGALFCSCPATDGQCLAPGLCRCPEDCNQAAGEVCDVAAGECRPWGACDADLDCLPGQYCGSGHDCLPSGTCQIDADCQLAAAGDFCSTVGVCLIGEECLADADCGGDAFCGCRSGETPEYPGVCAPGAGCVCSSDCAPGRSCLAGACQVTAASCDANGPMACLDGYWCCDADVACCPQGMRCSVLDGVCIAQDECILDQDCALGFRCLDYACRPQRPCSAQSPGGSCGPGQFCSAASGCILEGTCVTELDCPSREICDATFACEPAPGCGALVLVRPRVRQNVLIMLDRSARMGEDGLLANAKAAVEAFVLAHAADTSFGLAVFPATSWASAADCAAAEPGGADACSLVYGCIWVGAACIAYPPVCSACAPGRIDVRVGPGTAGAIHCVLEGTWPDGSTCAAPGITASGYAPVADTLWNIAGDLRAAGLDNPAAQNYVLLITASDTSCADLGGGVGACEAQPDPETWHVEAPLQILLGAVYPVRTVVVGMAGVTRPELLNCHAVSGGASQCPDSPVCAGYTPAGEAACLAANCLWEPDAGSCVSVSLASCLTATAATGVECYHDAGVDLASVLYADVAGLASCSFALGAPYYLQAAVVYLDRDDGRVPDRLVKGVDWDYDPVANAIVPRGAACTLVRMGARLVVVLGCEPDGG